MTPEDLAGRHPRLYHVTEPGAWPSIEKFGLLSSQAAIKLFEASPGIVQNRRAAQVKLRHPNHGEVILNDQIPLSEEKLRTCLDDGLSPKDWLAVLNARVFFWPDEANLKSLLEARLNRRRPRDVLVFDTLSLALKHMDRLELCPINSGATIRKPARRGLTTFTLAVNHSYKDWQKLRGKRDKVREIVLNGSLPDPRAHLVELQTWRP